MDKHTSSNNIQPIKEPRLAPAQEVKGLITRVELIQNGSCCCQTNSQTILSQASTCVVMVTEPSIQLDFVAHPSQEVERLL